MKLLFAVALLVLVPVQWENVCVRGSDSESVHCREEERSALLHINASMSINTIHSLDGKWEGKECCRWERVTCDPITGHVTQLDLCVTRVFGYDDGILLNATLFLPLRQLRSLSLSGHGIYNFTDGAGLETWSNLTKLEILDLSENSLDGSIIYDLASVPSLRKLDLSWNDINSSNLPINGFESWFNLTKLQMLDLSDNSVPKNMISSLTNVSSLRELYLDFTMREGNVPVKELSALNLEVVSLVGCSFNGSFPYVGHWSSLKALSLASNALNGTLTSKGLCRLKNLEELDLSGNNFVGNLPLCMGDLSSLKLVDLHDNQFQVKFPSIFERLVSLRFLFLSGNQLEGTMSMRLFLNHTNLEFLMLSTSASYFRVEVVDFPFQLQVLELANCILDVEPTFLYSQHNLKVLDLSNTSSKGALSAMWLLENNTNLKILDLHKNLFTGPLQLPFLTHENLSMLDISDNYLSGELPANITTKLPNLWSLILSKNCFQGPFPHMPTSNLETLDLSSNNLHDDIHNSFSRIQPSIPSFMDLSNNKFYGSFTSNMSFPLGALLLYNNNISGYIPSSICNTSFGEVDISNNNLKGVLPNCIGRAELSILNLSGNRLKGSLPLEMCTMPILNVLDLSNNELSGSIPPCSNQSTLNIVVLSNNYLTGKFPITWLNISYLSIIDIRENHLCGELPIWIYKESILRMLQAGGNLFRGPIPEQICQFKNLRILDLSHNNLSGEIPSCITDSGSVDSFLPIDGIFTHTDEFSFTDANFLLDLSPLTFIDGHKDSMNFGLKLMSKGRIDFYLEEILQLQGIIDLSSNKLVGKIPEDIGRMNWLVTLNLSNNHLCGAIPNSISNLHQLESLDLSHNSLTGEIPRELIELNFLTSFSVAYNNLSGPTLGVEAQFISFSNSSYEGNPNLCGPPLSKSCGTTQPLPNVMSERYDDTDFLILFGSFCLFFVASFWCFMVVLYFMRNLRYTLFTLVDHYGDMIYVKVVLLTRKIGAAQT